MDIAASKPVWSGDSTACPELYREYLALYRDYLCQHVRYAQYSLGARALLLECRGGGQFGDSDVEGCFDRGAGCSGSCCVGGDGDKLDCARLGSVLGVMGSGQCVQHCGDRVGVECRDRASGQAKSGAAVDGGSGDGVCGAVRHDGRSGTEEVSGACASGTGEATNVSRGKHYLRNKAKREKDKEEKRKRASWRSVDSGLGGSSAGSVAASVQTVDTRTGVEIEAAQTLALRRVEENKVKIVEAKVAARLAEHRLKALNDKERSVAIDRLAAARLEEKINTAKSKSQESFKKCDESLKSLGSSGSAGEFALKMQIKDAKDNEQVLKFVRQQNDFLSKYVSPEVLDAMGRQIKPPVLQEEFDAFGDCPSDYDEDECEAYYNELNRRNDKTAMFEALW